jgi:hypothetical protein
MVHLLYSSCIQHYTTYGYIVKIIKNHYLGKQVKRKESYLG